MSKSSDHLATALERVGRKDEALQVLVEAEAQIENLGDRGFVESWNLIARQHLAKLYRDTGRTPDASAVEAELRAQLKLSEPNHIVLRGLSPVSSYQASLN